MTSETAREFKIGDVIAKVGYPTPATVLGQGAGRYFVRWRGGGGSMLWTDEVERDYVLLEGGIDDDCVGASDGKEEVEDLIGDLFDFSLKGYSIWSFGMSRTMREPELGLYLKKTRDYSTNIVPETLDALRYLLS